MWDQRFIKCGVVKVESNKIKIFKDPYNHITLHIGKPVNFALWVGDILNVYLEDGRIRRYKDPMNFVTI